VVPDIVRIGFAIALLAGLTAVTVLVAWQGFAEVGGLLMEGGPGVAAMAAVLAFQFVLCAIGWRFLLAGGAPCGLGSMTVIRWVRDSVNDLLPVGKIGGDVIGARLLMLRQADTVASAASVVADKTIEVATQMAIGLIGAVLILNRGQSRDIEVWLTSGVVVMMAIIGAFVLAQRLGMLKLAERAVTAVLRRLDAGTAEARLRIHDAVWALYRDPQRMLGSTAWHVASWGAGTVGTWLVLQSMGFPVSLVDAFILESVAQAVTGVGFLVPGNLGAQEAGYMAIGTLIGLPPEVGLSVALIRRLANLIVSVPGVVWWKVFEARRLLARWRTS
jgi:hypothetical protein